MALRDVIQSLDAKFRPGLSVGEIRDFETRTHLSLPPELREMYAISNGFLINKLECELMSIERVEQYLNGFRICGITALWGYIPFTESNDSNPFCVLSYPLLKSYIARVYHDDLAEIKFRSLETFLTTLNSNATSLDHITSEFESSLRTDVDSKIAGELMLLSRTLSGSNYIDAIRFALTLYSEKNLNEIQEAIQDTNTCVRDAALNKLRTIPTRKAFEILNRHSNDPLEFAKRCAALLKHSGINATVVHGRVIQINPNGRSIALDKIYSKRRDADCADLLLKVAKESLGEN